MSGTRRAFRDATTDHGFMETTERKRDSMSSRWLSVGLVLCALVTSPVAPVLVHAQTTETTARQDDIAAFRGERVYARACASCHGGAGDGHGPAARYLDPRPRDFTLGMYKFRSTASGMLPTDEDLYRTVTRGIPTTTMPAFASMLTDRERHDVVAYIKGFSAGFSTMPPAEPIAIPAEPQATAQSIAEGKSAYMIIGCWTCHGTKGKGDGEAARSLTDVWGNEVKPVDFTLGRYKGGSDNRSVFRTLNTGIAGTPMPSYAAFFGYESDTIKLPTTLSDVYTQEEIAQVQAYLASQPTREQIRAMSPAEKEGLTDRRKWAMVHYLKSLFEKPGIWHRLFVEDTEVTR